MSAINVALGMFNHHAYVSYDLKKTALLVFVCVLVFLSLSSCDNGGFETDKAQLTEFFSLVFNGPNEDISLALEENLPRVYLGDTPSSELETPTETLTRQQPLYDILSQYVSPEYMTDNLEDFWASYILSVHQTIEKQSSASEFVSLELETFEDTLEFESSYYFTVSVKCVDSDGNESDFQISGSLRVNEESKITYFGFNDSNYSDYIHFFSLHANGTTYRFEVITPPLNGFTNTLTSSGNPPLPASFIDAQVKEMKSRLYSQYLDGELSEWLGDEEYDKEFFDNLVIIVTELF